MIKDRMCIIIILYKCAVQLRASESEEFVTLAPGYKVCMWTWLGASCQVTAMPCFFLRWSTAAGRGRGWPNTESLQLY